MFALFVAVGGLSAAIATAANPPQPTYGTAVVDGSYSEWNPQNDFFAAMYTGGDASKPLLSNGYLRYDCSTHTLYVLVLQAGIGTASAVPLLTDPTGNAWAELNDGHTKVYTDTSGDDGTPPDFHWIGLGYDPSNPSYAQGYEASFIIQPGSYSDITVHVEALNAGGSQTSAFTGFKTAGANPLTLDCSSPPPAPAYTITKAQRIGSGSYSASPITGNVGDTIDYQVTVANTGNTGLTFGSFSDPNCDTLTGGPSGAVAAGSSTTYTCHHVLTSADATAGSYSNTASVTGTPPSGDGSPIDHTSNTVVANVDSPGATPAPAFTIVKTQSVSSGSSSVNSNDHLTVEKQEQFIGMSPGQTQTVTLACPSGYVVLDGSPLIQEVDQGTGSTSDIQVLRSESTGTGAYTFTLHNPTAGNAQAQAFVTCVQRTTTDGGQIAVSDPPVSHTTAFGAGTASQTLSCPSGTVAVDPGYDFTGGQGTVTGSEPSADLGSWIFTIAGTQAGSVSLSIRCLSSSTSDGDQLLTQALTKQVTVPGGQTITSQLICPVGYKGVTASYELPAGITLLGHEPQPITRVFTLQNTTGSDQTATVDLVCLLDTTGSSSSSTPFTQSDLNGSVDETVNYRITVTDTGNTDLNLSDFSDAHCDAGTLAGGPGSSSLAPGGSTTYTCSHVLTSTDAAAGSYSNTASVTATPPSGDGSAITQGSNTVVVNLGSDPGPVSPTPSVPGPSAVSGSSASGGDPQPSPGGALAQAETLGSHLSVDVGRHQRGPGVRVRVTGAGSGSRVEVDAYTRLANGSRGALLGRSVRSGADGTITIVTHLDAAARHALRSGRTLHVMVVVTVSTPGGGSQQVTRTVAV